MIDRPLLHRPPRPQTTRIILDLRLRTDTVDSHGTQKCSPVFQLHVFTSTSKRANAKPPRGGVLHMQGVRFASENYRSTAGSVTKRLSWGIQEQCRSTIHPTSHNPIGICADRLVGHQMLANYWIARSHIVTSSRQRPICFGSWLYASAPWRIRQQQATNCSPARVQLLFLIVEIGYLL